MLKPERVDVNPDIQDFSGETALKLSASRGHTNFEELLSAPKPSPPLAVNIDEVSEHRLPTSSDLLPSLTQPSITFVCRRARAWGSSKVTIGTRESRS